MAWTVLIGIYQEYGMKFEEATKELVTATSDPSTPEAKQVREADNERSLVMLQAMMGGSDFGGPRG